MVFIGSNCYRRRAAIRCLIQHESHLALQRSRPRAWAAICVSAAALSCLLRLALVPKKNQENPHASPWMSGLGPRTGRKIGRVAPRRVASKVACFCPAVG